VARVLGAQRTLIGDHHGIPNTEHSHRGRGILILEQVVESLSIHKAPDGTRVQLRHPTAWYRGRDLAAAYQRQRGLCSGASSATASRVPSSSMQATM
jgi:hypothetical protein